MRNRLSIRLFAAGVAALVFAGPSPVFAAEIEVAHSAAAAGPVSFGPRLNAALDSIVGGLSLKSDADLLAGIKSLTASYLKEGALEQRLALAALTQPAAEADRIIGNTDLSKATAARLAKLVAKAAKAAEKRPDMAQAVAAARAAAQTTKPRVAANETRIAAAVDAFLGSSPAETAPVAESPVEGKTGSSPVLPAGSRPAKAGELPGIPEGRPVFSYGAQTLPLIAYPSEGADISGLWRAAQAQAQGPAMLQAQYNFDDLEMAKAIVAASRAGQKQIIVGDYSNWFPAAKMQAKTGAQTDAKRSAAMEYILANMNPNIELYILKGLTDIGINHNKFTVFAGQAGELLQGGSFNYTATSQNNHWENVIFTTDAERVAYFKQYHAWLVRRARKFSPDLQPEEPRFDPSDPIPTPPASQEVSLHGVPFPKASFSPNGGGEERLVQAESLVREALDILMFSPFPTPKMAAQISALLAAGKKVRMVADAGQIEHAGLLVPLIKAGMQVRIIQGPDVAIHHQVDKDTYKHSKQHEKVMLFDGHLPDGIVKMGDSLNISINALDHNFENIQFWGGVYAAVEQAHFEYVWSLSTELSAELMAKLEAEEQKHAAAGVAAFVSPWQGPAAQEAAPTGR